MLDISKLNRVHFLGIGGISISSLALFLRTQNIAVSGSDRIFSNKLLELSDNNCTIYVGEEFEALEKADLVVFSSAIPQNSPEMVYCKTKNIPTMERYIFLGHIAKLFQNVIAISGTHGKTTTTALMCHIFKNFLYKHYAHIGGEAIDISNFYYSGNDYFVTEACEYKKSLLSLYPNISIILNVENDHPDTYHNLQEIYTSFSQFIRQSQCTVINGDSPFYESINQTNNNLITFGKNPNNQYTIENIKECTTGGLGYDILHYGCPLCHIRTSLFGCHNVYNITSCVVVCTLLGMDINKVAEYVGTFKGVKRRFEEIGLCQGARIISDYAHHPTEIKESISTANKILKPGKKLYVVFQPHTYSRTLSLFAQFITCFENCDCLIILKEYSAREDSSQGLSAHQLYDNITHANKHYYDNTLDVSSFLLNNIMPDDIVLILGAGDVDNVAKILVI
ncbi:MAG: UDP-N-acetylmuramate--L-alanine ligase [Clostridia bacterium]